MRIVYLDMDEVLADMHGHITKITGIDIETLKADQGKFFGVHLPMYVRAMGFKNAGIMPRARELVSQLLERQKRGHIRVGILTSCGHFYHPISEVVHQKRMWIEENMPELNMAPFCTTTSGVDKSYLASDDAFLIDDRDKNCQKFIDAGGWSCHDPERLDRMYAKGYTPESLEDTLEQIDSFYEHY